MQALTFRPSLNPIQLKPSACTAYFTRFGDAKNTTKAKEVSDEFELEAGEVHKALFESSDAYIIATKNLAQPVVLRKADILLNLYDLIRNKVFRANQFCIQDLTTAIFENANQNAKKQNVVTLQEITARMQQRYLRYKKLLLNKDKLELETNQANAIAEIVRIVVKRLGELKLFNIIERYSPPTSLADILTKSKWKETVIKPNALSAKYLEYYLDDLFTQAATTNVSAVQNNTKYINAFAVQQGNMV